MKKISLFVLALSFFAACKNDAPASATSTDNTTTTTSNTAAGQEEKMANGKANAVAQYKALNDLITEFDAMPADFRNKPEAQNLRQLLGDISGKANIMMQAIDPQAEAATAASEGREPASQLSGGGSTDPTDAVTSMKRYGEAIAQARAQFNQMAANYKK